MIAEAVDSPVQGWDFEWLDSGAPVTKPLPWDYPQVVSAFAAASARMLDMGTGGGEALLELPVRAAFTVANEAWPPNVALAGANLRAQGIPVVQDEGAPDNMDPRRDPDRGRLPYRSGAFDLVANRHEAFAAPEVVRVLRAGGTFVTQQVDFHWCDSILEALELDAPDEEDTWLPLAVDQLETAGAVMVDARTGAEERAFQDIATLVRYLRIISWAIPGFDAVHYDDRLRRLHARLQQDPLAVRETRLLVVARKA